MGPISADIDLGHNQVMSGAALVTNEACSDSLSS